VWGGGKAKEEPELVNIGLNSHNAHKAQEYAPNSV
jgi:hypothetical protein